MPYTPPANNAVNFELVAYTPPANNAVNFELEEASTSIVPIIMLQYRQRKCAMRYLRTNTACRVTVGPFFDPSDGVTPETNLTVTNEKLTLVIDDGNVPTLVLDTAPTASGGNNDMVHITGDDAGFYDLELTASNTNYVGRAMLSLTDAANHCPVFHEFMILPANIYDSMILGSDLFDVSVTQLAGVAQSLTDLKDFADDGYDPSTNKIQGLVLADAVTVVNGLANDVITAAATAADFGTEVAAAVWDRLTSALTTVGSIGKLLVDRIDAAISSRASQSSVDVIDGIVDDILLDTAEIGAAGAGLTNINLPDQTMNIVGNITGNLSGSVGSVTGLTTSDVGAIKAKTDNLPSDPADASDIASAFGTVNSTLSTIAGYVDTEVAAIKTVTDKLDDTLEDDGGTYRFTANSLEEAPSGSVNVQDIVDGILDENRTTHNGANTVGEAINRLDETVSSRATQDSVDNLKIIVSDTQALVFAK